jgi:hypothetical protein
MFLMGQAFFPFCDGIIVTVVTNVPDGTGVFPLAEVRYIAQHLLLDV